MFPLRVGYFISGFITGLILLLHFLVSLPDGKLHIVACDVGQGDATYIRFADGSDMLVDGGSNDKVLGCLGKYMPFWDRTIDMLVLTHPEDDHLRGLLSVTERYNVGYFVHSDIRRDTEQYRTLVSRVRERHAQEKVVTSGEYIRVGGASIRVVWPSADRVAAVNGIPAQVLGKSTVSVNEESVVFWLRYGRFDALFPGDFSLSQYHMPVIEGLADEHVELLKVPHHGSKFAMDRAFVTWLKPHVAIVSVGSNNTYGHPSEEVQTMLADEQANLLRTDEVGDIEIVSDGDDWKVVQSHKRR